MLRERAGGAREDERVGRVRRAEVDVQVALRLQLVEGRDGQRIVTRDLAGLEAGGHRGVGRDALEVDLGGQRLVRRIPVVRVGERLQLVADLPLAQLERARAHDAARRGAERLALRDGVGLLEDESRRGGELALEPEIRLLQRDGHLRAAVGGDRLHAVEHLRVEAAVGGAGRLLEAVDDVGRRHRMAVPELGPGMDLEHHRRGVGEGDGCQAVLDDAGCRLADEGVAERRDDRVLGVVERDLRIERADLAVGDPRDRLGVWAGRGRGGRDEAGGGGRLGLGGSAGRGGGCGLAAARSECERTHESGDREQSTLCNGGHSWPSIRRRADGRFT